MTPSVASARERWARGLGALCGLLALACAAPHALSAGPNAGARECPAAQASAAPRATTAAKPRAFHPGQAGLALRLVPKPEAPALCVQVSAYGDNAQLRSWRLLQAAPTELLSVRQLFEGGHSRALSVAADGGGVQLLIPTDDQRESSGVLTIDYCVRAAAFNAAEPLTTAVDPNHFRATGERALLLPDVYRSAPVPTRVTLQAAGLGAPPGAASSLGVGLTRELDISVSGLQHAAFIAGPLGSARFNGPEGSDEAAWVGYTAFDPRPVAAQVATFRSAVRDYFGDPASTPLTLLLLSDGRSAGDFDVARRTASVLVQVGMSQPWDGPLSLAVSHQVVREWLGSKLRLSAQGSAVWFNEGFSRFLARELSFRMGQIEPTEYAQEVEALTSVSVTSPLAALSAAQLAPKLAAGEPAALTLEVARGALWASQLHADLARKGQSLHKILRDLYGAPAPATAQQLMTAVDAALGCEATACSAQHSFDKWILSGASPSLSGDALGVCFKAVPRSYPIYQRGFSVTGGRVSELTAKGPAGRAGLKLGDKLLSLRDRPGNASAPLTIRVERGGAPLEFSFLPQSGSVSSTGWVQLRHIAPARCPRP